jgi:hypothetical protein
MVPNPGYVVDVEHIPPRRLKLRRFDDPRTQELVVGVLAESPFSSYSALRPFNLSTLPGVGVKIGEDLPVAIDRLKVQPNTPKE